MKSVSPNAENDDLQPADGEIDHSEADNRTTQDTIAQDTTAQDTSPDQHEPDNRISAVEFSPIEFSLPASSSATESSSVGELQNRYATQLNADIEQLETEKAKLQAEILELKREHAHLQSQTGNQTKTATNDSAATTAASLESNTFEENTLERDTPEKDTLSGPILPGEKEAPPSPLVVSANSKNSTQERSIELPTPATSEQKRQLVMQRQRRIEPVVKANARKNRIRGLVLSAIATLLTAWHYGLINTLHQGGSWLGADIGQITLGFVPAVALLWLRMLVMVPVLVFLAPKLYHKTWEDLQDWLYHDDRRFLPLLGSGITLFFSQVFLYQSIGATGAIVGSALLFLYPLTSTPLELAWGKERTLTPFGLLALVAIAMGGLLVAKPALSIVTPTGILLGLLASVALSVYITLTNLSYRQQCHPVPTAVIQFSTVAVLSSLVLLVKPLKMVNISWLSFCLWGLLIGVLMLIAYLFTYSSLRLISGKTTIIAATTPFIVLLLSWSFLPQPTLAIIQWTGILLISLGGIALGKEKLAK